MTSTRGGELRRLTPTAWAQSDHMLRARADYDLGYRSRLLDDVAAESLLLFVDELDLAWQSYMTSGGFPRAVAEHEMTGEVGKAFLRDLVAWLHRDVDPDAGEDSVPRLLRALEARCASPLSRRALAEELGYGSRQTVDLRLARLVHAYAAIWCHHVPNSTLLACW